MNEKEIISFIDECSINNLWLVKGMCEKKLVSHLKITNNFVGERAVDLAIEAYAKKKGFPKLHRTWTGTKEVDLYSLSNIQYSVKGLKGKNKVTSPFPGYEGKREDKLFDYVIIVRMDEFYQLLEVLQVKWEVFCTYAKLNRRDKNYKLTLTNDLRKDSEKVYPEN